MGYFTVQWPTSANTRCFFFNDTATTEIYTLSLHDALPILTGGGYDPVYYYQTVDHRIDLSWQSLEGWGGGDVQAVEHTTGHHSRLPLACRFLPDDEKHGTAVTLNETASTCSLNNNNGPGRY